MQLDTSLTCLLGGWYPANARQYLQEAESLLTITHTITRKVGLLTGSMFLAIAVGMPAALAQTQVEVTLLDGAIQPQQIVAANKQKVRIAVHNEGNQVHNLVIPDFYVFTQNLQPGESVNVSFTPDKTGSFPYYSDTGGKKEAGMQGKLVVH